MRKLFRKTYGSAVDTYYPPTGQIFNKAPEPKHLGKDNYNVVDGQWTESDKAFRERIKDSLREENPDSVIEGSDLPSMPEKQRLLDIHTKFQIGIGVPCDCGSRDLLLSSTMSEQGFLFRVTCEKCGLFGPQHPHPYHAVAIWNICERTAPSA